MTVGVELFNTPEPHLIPGWVVNLKKKKVKNIYTYTGWVKKVLILWVIKPVILRAEIVVWWS